MLIKEQEQGAEKQTRRNKDYQRMQEKAGIQEDRKSKRVR